MEKFKSILNWYKQTKVHKFLTMSPVPRSFFVGLFIFCVVGAIVCYFLKWYELYVTFLGTTLYPLLIIFLMYPTFSDIINFFKKLFTKTK